MAEENLKISKDFENKIKAIGTGQEINITHDGADLSERLTITGKKVELCDQSTLKFCMDLDAELKYEAGKIKDKENVDFVVIAYDEKNQDNKVSTFYSFFSLPEIKKIDVQVVNDEDLVEENHKDEQDCYLIGDKDIVGDADSVKEVLGDDKAKQAAQVYNFADFDVSKQDDELGNCDNDDSDDDIEEEIDFTPQTETASYSERLNALINESKESEKEAENKTERFEILDAEFYFDSEEELPEVTKIMLAEHNKDVEIKETIIKRKEIMKLTSKLEETLKNTKGFGYILADIDSSKVRNLREKGKFSSLPLHELVKACNPDSKVSKIKSSKLLRSEYKNYLMSLVEDKKDAIIYFDLEGFSAEDKENIESLMDYTSYFTRETSRGDAVNYFAVLNKDELTFYKKEIKNNKILKAEKLNYLVVESADAEQTDLQKEEIKAEDDESESKKDEDKIKTVEKNKFFDKDLIQITTELEGMLRDVKGFGYVLMGDMSKKEYEVKPNLSLLHSKAFFSSEKGKLEVSSKYDEYLDHLMQKGLDMTMFFDSSNFSSIEQIKELIQYTHKFTKNISLENSIQNYVLIGRDGLVFLNYKTEGDNEVIKILKYEAIEASVEKKVVKKTAASKKRKIQKKKPADQEYIITEDDIVKDVLELDELEILSEFNDKTYEPAKSAARLTGRTQIRKRDKIKSAKVIDKKHESEIKINSELEKSLNLLNRKKEVRDKSRLCYMNLEVLDEDSYTGTVLRPITVDTKKNAEFVSLAKSCKTESLDQTVENYKIALDKITRENKESDKNSEILFCADLNDLSEEEKDSVKNKWTLATYIQSHDVSPEDPIDLFAMVTKEGIEFIKYEESNGDVIRKILKHDILDSHILESVVVKKKEIQPNKNKKILYRVGATVAAIAAFLTLYFGGTVLSSEKTAPKGSEEPAKTISEEKTKDISEEIMKYDKTTKKETKTEKTPGYKKQPKDTVYKSKLSKEKRKELKKASLDYICGETNPFYTKEKCDELFVEFNKKLGKQLDESVKYDISAKLAAAYFWKELGEGVAGEDFRYVVNKEYVKELFSKYKAMTKNSPSEKKLKEIVEKLEEIYKR